MKRRKLFNNLRHFAGTKGISIACASLFQIVPVALLAIGSLSLITFFRHPEASSVGLFGVLMSLVGASMVLFKGKLAHLAIYAMMALGAVNANAGGGGQQLTDQQINSLQRDAVLSNSVEMTQQIFSQSINPAQQQVVNIQPKNVGLIKRFIVIVSGVAQNTDAAVDATSTPYGIQNVLSNIQFTDLNNIVRINTHGPHLANLNAVKGRAPYASALQTADWNGTAPLQSMAAQYGANFPVLVGLNALVHGTNKAFRMVYDLPLAYSDKDLRGAIYANLINAVMNIGLTINNASFVAAAADDTFAVLKAGTCSYLGNLQITVYQVYLDQLPIGKDGRPILPTLDLSTIYELKNSTFKAIAAGQDFPIPYANFRTFMSTFAIYNNTGGNDGHGIGADLNYWALQGANSVNIFKLDPLTAAMFSRQILNTDLPAGTYYFTHRKRPIITTQYGNMALVLNAITAGAAAYVNICWEDFALVNQITQAGSLAGGAA